MAGLTLDVPPDETFRRLGSNDPGEVTQLGETELAAYAAAIDHSTVPEGLLAAAHRGQDDETVVSTDDVFAEAGLEAV